VVDTNYFELWGQMFLQMAKMAKGPEGFFELFQNGFVRKEDKKSDAVYEQFMAQFQETFGKEGIKTFNSLMNEFYENVGVVPLTQYKELQQRYDELVSKVQELEKTIVQLKKKHERGNGTSINLIEQLSETVKACTDINQRFFENFSKISKK
jgi:hypothetical protein